MSYIFLSEKEQVAKQQHIYFCGSIYILYAHMGADMFMHILYTRTIMKHTDTYICVSVAGDL